MGWRIALVTLAGCGRLSFDAISDSQSADARIADAFVCVSPIGRDEDGDAVDDACDVCPNDANNTDSDGDRVGDACDPEPAIARQSIVMFDPMLTEQPGWTLFRTTIDGGGMIMSGRNNYAVAQRPLGSTSDTFIIGATVSAAGPGSHHIELVAGVDSNRYFYCELFESTSNRVLQFTYTFDGTNYLHDGDAPFTSMLVGGSGTLTMSIQGDETRCSTMWGADRPTVMGMRHAIATDFIGVSANNCDARVDYLLQIRTN